MEKQSKSKRGLFLAKYFWKFLTFRVYKNAWRVFIFHLLLLLWCLSSRVMSMLGNVFVSRVSFSLDVFMPEYSTTICFWAVFFFSCFTLSKFVCICWWADWLMVILVMAAYMHVGCKNQFCSFELLFFQVRCWFFCVLFCFSSHPKSSNIKIEIQTEMPTRSDKDQNNSTQNKCTAVKTTFNLYLSPHHWMLLNFERAVWVPVNSFVLRYDESKFDRIEINFYFKSEYNGHIIFNGSNSIACKMQ